MEDDLEEEFEEGEYTTDIEIIKKEWVNGE